MSGREGHRSFADREFSTERRHESGARRRLIQTYQSGLLNGTLPFWLQHAVDREHGGFMLALDRDGSVIDTEKGVWQQGRFWQGPFHLPRMQLTCWRILEEMKASGDSHPKRCSEG